MKKLLAVLLAVTMIATLIPSAFAVETDGEESWAIECDVEKLTVDLGMYGASCTLPFSTLNYTNTNDVFNYVDSSIDNDLVASKQITYPGAKPGSNAAYDTKGFITLYQSHWISFEVNVPQEGIYSFKVNYKPGKKNGGKMSVYVADASTFDAQNKNFGNKIGDYSCANGTLHDDPASVANKEWKTAEMAIETPLAKGKYTFTFQVEQSGNTGLRATIGNFTLTGTPIEEEELSGISIKYDIQAVMKAEGLHNTQEGTKPLIDVDYDTTNGFFDIISRVGTVSYASTAKTDYNFLKVNQGAQVVMNVNVPVDGLYSIRTDYQQAQDGTDVNVYIDDLANEKGSYSCYSSEGPKNMTAGSGSNGYWVNDAIVVKNVQLTAGEHMIKFAVPETGAKVGSVGTFELITEEGEGTTDMPGFIKVDNTTLAVDETANILGAVACSSDGTVKAQSDANTTYESSDTSVVTVSGTTITAVGAGTADITTTVGDVEAKRTITVLNKEVSGNVSLGVYSDVDGYVTVMVDETTSDVKVDSVAVGSWVRATAKTDDPNYIFRGWKRGSRDNGVWISEDTEIYFPIMTNTFLTAVYEPVAEEEDTVNVEFYNFNGQYLNTAVNVGTKTFAEIKPTEAPSLTGYTIPFWTVDGENAVEENATFKKLTRVVANYRNKDSFDVTIGDGLTAKISGTDTIAKSGEYDYDTVLILSSEKEGSWYIDGKLVAYGNAYALNVWNDAEITFDEKENNVPIIALDGETKANGARMISYDANGVNIAEVGIIFGKDAKITSFESKATAKKRGNSQGQFTAMPYAGDGKNARGYLIYNDKGTYRVIYAD